MENREKFSERERERGKSLRGRNRPNFIKGTPKREVLDALLTSTRSLADKNLLYFQLPYTYVPIYYIILYYIIRRIRLTRKTL